MSGQTMQQLPGILWNAAALLDAHICVKTEKGPFFFQYVCNRLFTHVRMSRAVPFLAMPGHGIPVP